MTKSILFVCNMNSVRSPMAAALLRLQAKGKLKVDSAGVYEGGLDPFVEMVMSELGMSLDDHEPKSLDDVDIDCVDLIVALTPEAVVKARRQAPNAKIEFWETENPSEERGSREAILDAYRRVRDELTERLAERFVKLDEKP